MAAEELPGGIIRDSKRLYAPFPQEVYGHTVDRVTATMAYIILTGGVRKPVPDANANFQSIMHRCVLNTANGFVAPLLTSITDLDIALRKKQRLENACRLVIEQNITKEQVFSMLRGKKEFPAVEIVE